MPVKFAKKKNRHFNLITKRSVLVAKILLSDHWSPYCYTDGRESESE